MTAQAHADEAELRIVPIESLLYDEAPIVSIESLRTTSGHRSDRESGALNAVVASSTSPSRSPSSLLRRRVASRAASSRTIACGASARPRRRRSRRWWDRHWRRTNPAAADEGTVTLEIGTLVYRGRAALERAAAVRQQLADELSRNGGLEAIQPLLQELLDLVPLALAES